MKECSTLFLIRKKQIIATPKKSFFTYHFGKSPKVWYVYNTLYYIHIDVRISLLGICLTYVKISLYEIMYCSNVSNNLKLKKIAYSQKIEVAQPWNGVIKTEGCFLMYWHGKNIW